MLTKVDGLRNSDQHWSSGVFVKQCSCMGIPIASGITLPPVPRSGRPRKYPIREMEVGHSFYIPEVEGKGKGPLRSVKSAVRAQLRGVPGGRRQFAFRREGQGWRCWRVA